jgi:hypothetical protein
MTRRALIIGWDGVRYDRLGGLDLPVLGKIAADGFLQRTEMPTADEAATSTAPGWSTNLTGVWPAKHGVTDNVPMPHRLADYPHLLQRYLSANPDRQTLACVCAAMLGSTKGPGPILATGVSSLIFHDVRTDPRGPIGRDPIVYADAVHHLTAFDYDLSFVYFAGTDKTAHLLGTTGDEYAEAIRREDAWTGGLLDAVRSRSTYADEDWLIVVTTDHGHLDEGGHGGNSPQERQAFVAMSRLGAPLEFAPSEDLANVDIAPTVLTHLGVEVDPAWDLDGRALQSVRARG